MTAQSGVSLRRGSAAQRGARLALCAFLFVGALPGFAGTIYKWVDAQGQVHFTDTPPEGIPYQTIQARPDGPAQGPATPPPARHPAPSQGVQPQRMGADAGAVDGRRCVDALYEIMLLNQQRRVFKERPDGTRQYLDDADRPAELDRLQRIRDQSCSADPRMRAMQQDEAARLMLALSMRCVAAREKLEHQQDPASRTPQQEVAEQREFVQKYCPTVVRSDVWVGDWVIVRPRR